MKHQYVLRSLGLSGVFLALLLVMVRSTNAASACASCPGDLNDDGVVTIDEIIRAVNAALTSCPAPMESSTLLATSQTTCDTGDGTLGACPGSPSGQDGAIQAGVPLSYTDNGDGTVRDNASGLTWEKLADDDGIHDWDNTYTWGDAVNVKIAALNTAPCFAGHCDWRLPNRRELESLVAVEHAAPAVDPVFHAACAPHCTVIDCSCTQASNYWSSTSYQDTSLPGYAWSVDLNLGALSGFDKSLPFNVRAVRGGV